MTRTLERLGELGIVLPAAPSPAASYVQTRLVAIGDGRSLLYVAGQICREGSDVMTGRCPDEVSVDEANRRARLCGLAVLAQIEQSVGLDNMVELAQMIGFVRSVEGFTEQSKVVNGASDLFVEVFGSGGRYTRAAVGTNALPLGATVEIAAVAVVRTG
ncbi:MAG TPA: RidA family protein [Candidatus Dormibacteraeota bacterium]|nr:RidA family protein [Candidatus Dormibacteraeota bacterium]